MMKSRQDEDEGKRQTRPTKINGSETVVLHFENVIYYELSSCNLRQDKELFGNNDIGLFFSAKSYLKGIE